MVKKGARSVALSQEYIVDSDSGDQPELASHPPTANREVSQYQQPPIPRPKNPSPSLKPSAKPVARPKSVAKSLSLVTSEDAPTRRSPSSHGPNSNTVPPEAESSSEASSDPQDTAPTSRPDTTPTVTSSRQYEPPRGFKELALGSSSDVPDFLQALSSSKSQKEIWHITAPATVSLTSIKQLHANPGIDGAPILEHNGAHYGFVSVDKDSSNHALLPEDARNTYRIAPKSISRSLHLRKLPVPPAHPVSGRASQATRPPRFVATAQPTPRQLPKQRESLKIRYRPFGTDGHGDQIRSSKGEAKANENTSSMVSDASQARDSSLPNEQTPSQKPASSSSSSRKKSTANTDDNKNNNNNHNHNSTLSKPPVHHPDVTSIESATPSKKKKRRRIDPHA